MLIDMSDLSSIPEEVKTIILNFFENMPQEMKMAIKSQEISYDSDVGIAIEKYLGPFASSSYELYNILRDILYKHKLVCFHSTKILDESLVLDKGLSTNNWKSYSENMRDTYMRLGIDQEKIEEALMLIEQEYKRKYLSHQRNPQLCFFSNMTMLETEETAGYEQFCENIGGELARWALKEEHADLYDCLRNNGKAYIVKFQLPFKNISEYNIDAIIYQLISCYAASYFFNREFQIEFDGASENDIPKDDILELIPYTIGRYYFYE